jgi:GTP-binding protein
MSTPVEKIRNIAIIAHIDHGKTTLIDSIFRAAHTFREGAKVEERVMDSNDLEKERGITIRAKHCAVTWRDYAINIVDTPGHADFSGEVERVLSMVNSVLLLVDANEGPMPQTRYVLMRALRLGLCPIVVVNKVDRPNADPKRALHLTFDLFIELGATDEQADFKVLYGSGLNGWLVKDLETDPRRDTMEPLFETIVEHVPAPSGSAQEPFLMQISTLAWSDYVGRIGCGRVLQGQHRKGQHVVRTTTRWKNYERQEGDWEVVGSTNERSAHLWTTQGLDKAEVEIISTGEIAWISGPEDIMIGDTFSSPEIANPALPPLEIEEPTVSMFFLVNTGPFAGQDGKAFTLRQLRERLLRELRVNLALRVEDLPTGEGMKVSGRGELHLAILIEEMRREGIEVCVSRPEVITHRDENNAVLEPMEHLRVDVPDDYQGVVIEKLARRKGELTNMENTGTGVTRMEFRIPDARPHRLPQRVPHRHARPRHHVRTLHGLRPVVRRSRLAFARLDDRNGNGRGHELLAREPTGSRPALRRPDGEDLLRHGRRRALTPRGPPLQSDQEEGAHQLPFFQQGNRPGARHAAPHVARPGARMDRPRRTRRGHAQELPPAQVDPRFGTAQDASEKKLAMMSERLKRPEHFTYESKEGGAAFRAALICFGQENRCDSVQPQATPAPRPFPRARSRASGLHCVA